MRFPAFNHYTFFAAVTTITDGHGIDGALQLCCMYHTSRQDWILTFGL
jgi:hypothetical protein